MKWKCYEEKLKSEIEKLDELRLEIIIKIDEKIKEKYRFKDNLLNNLKKR